MNYYAYRGNTVILVAERQDGPENYGIHRLLPDLDCGCARLKGGWVVEALNSLFRLDVPNFKGAHLLVVCRSAQRECECFGFVRSVCFVLST